MSARGAGFGIHTKDIDFALAILLLVIGGASAAMAFAQKYPVTQIQMLGAVPTNVAAAGAFAMRKTTGSVTYVRESFLPFISLLMPSLTLDSPAISRLTNPSQWRSCLRSQN